MKEEILAAVTFFVRFVEKSEKFPRDQIDNFKKYLTELLMERFEKHWFPELPSRGQGYRCIRVNGVSPVDLTLKEAATKCGLSYNDLRLPTELTVWVDPNEVCYRLGESEGSYCTLATFPSEHNSTSTSISSLSTSLSSSSSLSPSENSSPSSSPPSTPHQEKMRKMQKAFFQRYQSLRVKSTPREMNMNFNPNRPMYRCDGPPYSLMPTFYRNCNRSHKNVLRV